METFAFLALLTIVAVVMEAWSLEKEKRAAKRFQEEQAKLLGG